MQLEWHQRRRIAAWDRVVAAMQQFGDALAGERLPPAVHMHLVIADKDSGEILRDYPALITIPPPPEVTNGE